jgi:type I restriction enzyme M protein
LQGRQPDFVLYQSGTNTPIGVIEAKKPNLSLLRALNQAEERYARPLQAPLVFAYNDTYVQTRYLHNGRPLKIDGEDVRQFIDHYTALRFVADGPEILSAPEHVQYSREQLIRVFKRTANLLREAGLTAGLERFGVFTDILFLKLVDEVCELRKHAGQDLPIPEHARWTHFQNMVAPQLHTYLKDVVWGVVNDAYGSIFGSSFEIESPEITYEIVQGLSDLNLTSADTDVKGDAFEYFLKNAYQGVRIKDLGEYFTPRNIVRTMVSMGQSPIR